jgi:hypothetical protein
VQSKQSKGNKQDDGMDREVSLRAVGCTGNGIFPCGFVHHTERCIIRDVGSILGDRLHDLDLLTFKGGQADIFLVAGLEGVAQIDQGRNESGHYNHKSDDRDNTNEISIYRSNFIDHSSRIYLGLLFKVLISNKNGSLSPN